MLSSSCVIIKIIYYKYLSSKKVDDIYNVPNFKSMAVIHFLLLTVLMLAVITA